jgi:adenylate kinase family enzyme
MFIILEGADGTGKTTLAKRLQEMFSWNYVHCSYNKDWNMPSYFTKKIYKALLLTKKTNLPTIIDRLWISELIYSEVYREGSKWPFIGTIFDKILKNMGCLYIFCISLNTDYEERFTTLCSDRKEMYLNKMTQVNDLYIDFVCGNKVLKCSERNKGLEKIIRKGFVHINKNSLIYFDSDWKNIDNFCEIVAMKQNKEEIWKM